MSVSLSNKQIISNYATFSVKQTKNLSVSVKQTNNVSVKQTNNVSFSVKQTKM